MEDVAAQFPSPLVGEGSGAPTQSAGEAPRERGDGSTRDAAEKLTPLRAASGACSPTRGERGATR
jgi:hypothetical protein